MNAALISQLVAWAAQEPRNADRIIGVGLKYMSPAAATSPVIAWLAAAPSSARLDVAALFLQGLMTAGAQLDADAVSALIAAADRVTPDADAAYSYGVALVALAGRPSTEFVAVAARAALTRILPRLAPEMAAQLSTVLAKRAAAP